MAMTLTSMTVASPGTTKYCSPSGKKVQHRHVLGTESLLIEHCIQNAASKSDILWYSCMTIQLRASQVS